MNTIQSQKVRTGRGFFGALDQSGGSTPKALAEYGVSKDRYSSDAEMFDLVHAMRTRVLTSPAFDGSRVLAAILFEQTMERDVNGVPAASEAGYISNYELLDISPAALALLTPGAQITLAVHCHQTDGGQDIDVGLDSAISQ